MQYQPGAEALGAKLLDSATREGERRDGLVNFLWKKYDHMIYYFNLNMGIIWFCLKMAYSHVLNIRIYIYIYTYIYIYVFLNIKDCRVHLQKSRETSDSWDEFI